MRLRLYKPEDFNQIMEINRESFGDPPPEDYEQNCIRNGVAWVIEEHGKVLGFLISLLRADNDAHKVFPHINNVAVRHTHRNLGIARQLINEFEDFYRFFYVYDLFVDVKNPAKLLYEKLGYKDVQLMKDYYGEGKDGMLMSKVR